MHSLRPARPMIVSLIQTTTERGSSDEWTTVERKEFRRSSSCSYPTTLEKKIEI